VVPFPISIPRAAKPEKGNGTMRELFCPSPEALCQFRFGPLEAYIHGYADLLRRQGYTKEAGWHKVRLVGEFSRWLDRKHVDLRVLNEQHVATFLNRKSRQVSRKDGDKAALALLLRHLRQHAVIPARAANILPTPMDAIEQRYQRFLLDERGLGQDTVKGYLAVVRRFLSHRFPDGKVEMDKLCAKDIAAFVLHDSRNRGRRACQSATSTLRGLLRFLFHTGQIATNLAPSVPAVAGWRLSELPRYLESAEVERVLKTCDRRRKTGKRDYAMLLLLARLGLRAGEVARLALGDIDWDTGELRIHGKGNRIDRLPLLQPVGEAIADYLRKARPRCLSRHLFVHAQAPYEGFARPPNGICSLVRRTLKRAGLNPPHKGAHILRHSLATTMLGEGASLQEIGRVLRHKGIQTTEIYAKVNLDALRKLAQPWPGGDQ
jgi:site-specific recombinase XerD